MTEIARSSGAVEEREPVHLEVEDVLKRAREAVASSREILQASRGPAGSAVDAAPPPADGRADAA